MALGGRIHGPGWWTEREQAATRVRIRPGFLTHMTDGRDGGYIEKTWGGAMEKSTWLQLSLGCCLRKVGLAAGERPEYKAL